MTNDLHAATPQPNIAGATGETSFALTARPTQAWQVNLRLVVWTLGVCVILVPILFFWHNYQVRIQATALRNRAIELYAREDWAKAATAIHKYLQLHPNDAESILLRAEAFDKSSVVPARQKRAVSLYLEAVQANPTRPDARLRLAELLFESSRYEEAFDQARRVIEELPDEVKAARVETASLRAQLGPAQRVPVAKVVESFQKALARHKGDIPLSIGMAELLRTNRNILPAGMRDDAHAIADRAMDDMVAENPNESQAFLARYRYRTLYGLSGASQDLEQARQITPDDPEVLLASATSSSGADREGARAFAKRLIEVAPNDRRGYLKLAVLHSQWNEPREAIDVLKQGIVKTDGDLDLNRLLLQMLLLTGDADEARWTLRRMEPQVRRLSPFLPAPIQRRMNEDLELAGAQLQLLAGKVASALPALKRLAASVTDSNDAAEMLAERQRRGLLLARAYSALGMHDSAGNAYDDLARLDPRSKEYRLRAAAEWQSSGDLDRAIQHFEAATIGEPIVPAAWLGLAEARLEQQLRRVSGESRDWTGIDAALQQAQTRVGDLPALLMDRATVAIARSDRQTALAILQQLMSNDELDPALLPRVAVLFQDAGDAAAADSVFDRYRNSGADPERLTMAQAELLRHRGKLREAIALFEQTLEGATDASRESLLRRLVSAYIEIGSIAKARERLNEARTLKASDLWVYEKAADLALMAGDATDLQRCESELTELEGPIGTLWRYFRALRLLDDGHNANGKPDLQQASQLLGEIEGLRPAWPNTYVLRGRISERNPHLGIAQAAENYQQALRLGARNLTTYQWLISALYRRNRFADAADYIRTVGQVGTLSADLANLAVPAQLQAGHIEDALRVARAAAEGRPGDAIAQLWYAQTLTLSGSPREAETVYSLALKIAPGKIETWSGMLWFLTHEKRQDEARKLLQKMLTAVEMNPRDRRLVAARGSDLIGDRAEAEKSYQEAIGVYPNDVELLEELGRFYFKFDHEKAINAYRTALSINPASTEARRVLALLLGLRGTTDDLTNAMQFLRDDRQSMAVEDRRLEIALLLLRGSSDIRGGKEPFREAAELAQKLIDSEEKPNPADRLLLAKALEELGDIDSAERQLAAVVETSEQPAFLAVFVEFLTRHDRLEQAALKLAILEENEPDAARTLQLKVALLERSHTPDEIEPAVDRFVVSQLELAKADEQKAAVLSLAVNILTQAKLYDAAEAKFRALVTIRPSSYGLYANWLAARGRVDEALALCRNQSSITDPDRIASTMIQVLTIAASQSDHSLAEEVLSEALAAVPSMDQSDIQLLLELGVLRVMLGKDEEAIPFYEQALAREPGNVAVLNNLALVLAETRDRTNEAVQHIDKALAVTPNSAELLDTRALVLMATGNVPEARDIFEQLCRTNPRNSRYRLHLAVALHQLNNSDESRLHAERAIHDGLMNEFLTPAEHRMVDLISGDAAPVHK